MHKHKQTKKESSRVEALRPTHGGETIIAQRLKEVTDNYRLRINDPNVALKISQEPVLKEMESRQLSYVKKKEHQKDDRRQQRVRRRFQANSGPLSEGLESDSGARAVDPDYHPSEAIEEMRESKVQGLTTSKFPSSVRDAGNQMAIAKRARLQAAKMIELAHNSEDGNPMREAVISRLMQGQDGAGPKSEADELLAILEEQQSTELCSLISSAGKDVIERAHAERYSGNTIVQGFIRAATVDTRVLRDQKLIIELFVPALEDVRDFASDDMQAQGILVSLLEACLNYFCGQQNPTPTVGLYRLAHSLGMVNKCVMAFIGTERSKHTLKVLLQGLGLSRPVVRVISRDPWNLGFSGLISLCAELAQDSSIQLCSILQKCRIEIDPTPEAKQIASMLRRCVLLGELLQSKDVSIPFEPVELLQFLSIAESLPVKEVRGIIEDPLNVEWVKHAQNLKTERESGRSGDQRDESKWAARSSEEQVQEEFALMVKVSRALEGESEQYCHNPFQCYAAAKAYAQKQRISVIVSPTGSGKTFIICLMAQAFLLDGKRVAIVVPNEWLGRQMEGMVGTLRLKVSILTLEQALCSLSFDVAICDESDELIMKSSVIKNSQSESILGFWTLLQKRSFLLTATASQDLQTILSSLYGLGPDRFINLAIALKDLERPTGSIHFSFEAHASEQNYMQTLERSVLSHLKERPIIVFYEAKKVFESVMAAAKAYQVPRFAVRNEAELAAARLSMQRHGRGLAVARRSFGRGADLRFKEDSVVLLTFLPEDMVEAKQLAGRSSRTLGKHRCTILILSDTLQPEDMQQHLQQAGKGGAADGVRALKVLFSMREEVGSKGDSELLSIFRKTWLVSMASVQRKLGKQRALRYEASFTPII